MKKKILHIAHAVGGVDVYLRLVSENINPDEFTTIIAHGNSNSKEKYFDQNGDEIVEYKISIQREISFLKDIRAIFKIVKILKKEKPQLIHAHSSKGGIIARMASLFSEINVLHTPHAYSFLSTKNRFKKFVFVQIEKFFKRFNSILLATSESEIVRGIQDLGYDREKAILFNNSILPIPKTSNPIPKFNFPDQYICTVGRPSYQKNIEMMIEVIRKVKNKIPNIHLVLMGVGVYSPNTENVEKLIKKYKLQSNITMIEWIDREIILQIISSSLMYISTSRYEGLPYSIIESLALSKACIVTDCDGNKDLVKNEYNGFVVDQENKDLMSEKIIELFFDKKVRERYGKNSFTLFEKNFNLVNNIKILEDIYRNYSLKNVN